MIKLILDYTDEQEYCGSTLWFESLEDTFEFIKKQNKLSYHSYYIEDADVIQEMNENQNVNERE